MKEKEKISIKIRMKKNIQKNSGKSWRKKSGLARLWIEVKMKEEEEEKKKTEKICI